MQSQTTNERPAARRRRRGRRGFNLVEMLIAMSITGTLLAATMVALDASFMAYQSTTEIASTHTISRLTLHRMLTLIRTGEDFGPMPADPLDSLVESNFIEFLATNGQIIVFEWDEDDESLLISIDDGGGTIDTYTLLEGVVAQYDDEGDLIAPFTLEYEHGNLLYRATVNLAIQPDDNLSMEMEGGSDHTIRLVATAMPRSSMYR